MRKIRLQTKFLVALLAISLSLTVGTLLVVRYTVEKRIRETLRQDLKASANDYQIFEKQRVTQLARTAALIANLPSLRALMTTEDQPTIQDASADILKLSGADLLLLADRTGKIIALHSAGTLLDRSEAQSLLTRSLQRRQERDWWFAKNHLFELLLQPISFGPPPRSATIGLLAIGHEVNDAAAKEFGEISGSEVVFVCDRKVIASTLLDNQQRDVQSESVVQSGPTASRQAIREIHLGKERFLVSTVDLSIENSVPVFLSVLKSFDKETPFLNTMNRILVALGLLATLAGGFLALLLSTNFTRPLAALVAGVKALERGDYSYQLSDTSRDEVGALTRAFARMRKSLQSAQQEQKELETQLRQAHKMEAIGRLAGGVAHDFNNLLTIICGHADLLMDRFGANESTRGSADQIHKAANRAVAMTRQLLAFSRMQVLQPRIIDLNATIADMGKMLPRLIGEHIDYSFVPEPKLALVKADPGQIEQVLMNLAVNARDAMPDGGKLTVQTANAVIGEKEVAKLPAMAAGKYALILVSDTGQGMDERTKAHIFEPFFTTKEVGKGTGLGLATVYGIVKQSGGFIWVESSPGAGATFEIYLPPAVGATLTEDTETAKPIASKGSETILVVEDESAVRELACEFLRSAGYRVLEACDGLEALEVASRFQGEIHLLLTDMLMPRMGGRELAERLRATRPSVKVVIVSGYSEYSGNSPKQHAAGTVLLPKPFSLHTLTAKVREALTGDVLA